MLMTEQRSPCKQLHIFEYPHKVKIIIHIDSLVLGNAIGGTRMLSYDNVDSAIQDVKKLSGAMSLKASIHNQIKEAVNVLFTIQEIWIFMK